MAKFAIVFCMLLVASVAYAKYSSEGEQGSSRAVIPNACSNSITNLYFKVVDAYTKVMALSLAKESIDLATIWRDLAARKMYALYKEATDPATEMPVEGNAMTCSNDIAYKAYDAFYQSWKGLEELAEVIAEQRERIEQDRINREGH